MRLLYFFNAFIMYADESVAVVFSIVQDFTGSLSTYSELGDEGNVQVRASELLEMMGV